MERLYQIIARHFSSSEIQKMAVDLNVFVPPNSDPTSMARELFLGAERNLRLDLLINEVYTAYEQKAAYRLDLRSNLYELIAGTFNKHEAENLTVRLGYDQMKDSLDSSGLTGWDHDKFFKAKKAELIQKTAVDQDQYSLLLEAVEAIQPNLNLMAFKVSTPGPYDVQKDKEITPLPAHTGPEDARRENSPQVVYHIYGDNIGGDKVGGDKADRDIIKDVTVSDNTGSAISFGGDASVSTANSYQNREDLLKIINQISEDLGSIQSELAARDAAEAAEALAEVEHEISSDAPDAAWVIRKLKNVSEIASAVTAASQVTANIGQAIQVVRSLFGG